MDGDVTQEAAARCGPPIAAVPAGCPLAVATAARFRHGAETLPAAAVRKVAAAAAATLRQVSQDGLKGRPMRARMLREALLDHVPVVVEADGQRVDVPQRLVQAVVRMVFLGRTDTPVQVRCSRRWVGLAAQFGTAWLPPPSGPLSVRPI